MKKTRSKLALRKEVLRTLANMSLTHAVGGQETNAGLAGDTTAGKICPAAPIAVTGQHATCTIVPR